MTCLALGTEERVYSEVRTEFSYCLNDDNETYSAGNVRMRF